MRILFVCDANRARSPIAAAMFARELDRRGMANGIGISSAGMTTQAGLPAVTEAVEAAAGLGLDISAHRSRPLIEDDLEADLIVTMTRSQLDALVPRRAGMAARSYTLIELVALLALADLRGNLRRLDEAAPDWGDSTPPLLGPEERAPALTDAWDVANGRPAVPTRPAAPDLGPTWSAEPTPGPDAEQVAGAAGPRPTSESSRASAAAHAIRLGIEVANGQRSRRRSALLADERPRELTDDDVIDPMRAAAGRDPDGLDLPKRMDATVTELERLTARLARLLVGPLPPARQATAPATPEAPDPQG